jgi:hypothetical protein
MTRAHKTLIILFVAALGSWGCSQGEHRTSASQEKRIKAMEAKIDSLASDCRLANQAREELEQKLVDVQKENERLHKQVDLARMVVQERDELKVTINARTTERDAYQAQLVELRKGIQSLLSRVEASIPHADEGGQKTSMIPKL